jgi:hypothetical protein
MGATLLAWLGLISVLLIALHWALEAAQARGRRLPGALLRLLRLLERLPQGLSADTRAERRRAERLRLAQQHREAIARNSRPTPLDESPPVEWDGNVARPQFGGERRRQRPHNLH